MNASEGHRERLRRRFQTDPDSLSEVQRLELLLTYAIPRHDIALLAEDLLTRFGSIENALSAPKDELVKIPGIGEATLTLFKLLLCIFLDENMSPTKTDRSTEQLALFNLGTEEKISETKTPEPKQRLMRVFANDEIANSLELLPESVKFQTLDAFKQFLNEKLPYNASATRLRRSNNILDRFFPNGNLDIPLTYFVAHCSLQADLKAVIFYHMLKAEPIAAKYAEELIWPALPHGQVDREQSREFVLRYIPTVKVASQAKILQALYHTYKLCGVGNVNEELLFFKLHAGTLESFLYILTSEFPKPGIYSFEALYSGPLHRWMLWDREWIRQQLYNLQDFGILTKVSEIDTVRQFSLAAHQPMALRLFFEHPERNQKAIREQAESQGSAQED